MTKAQRIAIDTNVLLYAEGLNDVARLTQATDLLTRLRQRHKLLVPIQVLGEFVRVLRRKARMTPAQIDRSVDKLTQDAELCGTTPTAFAFARRLTSQHGLDIWDAVILSVAAEHDATLMLSEDMQDGFVWRRATVTNPFAEPPHPLLRSAIEDNQELLP